MAKFPDYCDERAEKFFSLGSNGKTYDYYWKSNHPDIRPTKMVVSGYQELCAYCGKRGKPLQPYFRSSFSEEGSSVVTGYSCICKDAMDSLEVIDKLKTLEEEFYHQKVELLNTAPKINPQVLSRIISKNAENAIACLQRSLDVDDLEQLGLTIKN